MTDYCPNCGEYLELMGYRACCKVKIWKGDAPPGDYSKGYDDMIVSDLTHSVHQCPHCYSVWLMPEE